jgi:hypothetical protein
MHFKQLSLTLLMVASACAHQVPRRSAQFPALSGDDLLLPSSRSNGKISSSTTIWDHVSNGNTLKKMCVGPQRNGSWCSQIEAFGKAMQDAGTKTQKELHEADQINAQKPLSIESMQEESQQMLNIVLNNAMTIMNNAAPVQEALQSLKASDQDKSEVILAPIIMFAQYAGSTRAEQRNIAEAIVMVMMEAAMAQAQQQQQPMMPGRSSRR